MELIQLFVRARVMKESVGASPYGGDLNKWPSRLVDAFTILQDEHSRIETMKMVQDPRGQQQQKAEQQSHGSTFRR